MSPEFIFETFLDLKKDYLSFSYLGNIHDEITDMLIQLSESNIDHVAELSKMRNKVSFLMVESFQNIVRHSGNIPVEGNLPKPFLFQIRNIGATYYIASANVIPNVKTEMLKNRIGRLNTLTQEELKSLYMEVLSQEQDGIQRGAGLGLIEMARKSGHKLECFFEPINDEYTYFYLQIKMSGKKNPSEDEINLTIESTQQLHSKLSGENILLLLKGNFSQELILPVLKMVEENMSSFVNVHDKNTFFVLGEILQNIPKHSFVNEEGVKEGIFFMEKFGEYFAITSGNYVENHYVVDFEEKLNAFSKLSVSELNVLYRKYLREGNETEHGGAGLGLIDIIRLSNCNFQYHFQKINEAISFFTMRAVV